MIEHIKDEYMHLKSPERSKEIGEAMSRTASERFKEVDVEALQKRLDEMYIEHYRSQLKEDSDIDPVLYYQAVKARRKQRAKGAKTKGIAKKKRTVALKAFLEIDLNGGTTSEAKNLARKHLDEQFRNSASESTISDWLTNILHLTDIKKSPRGRPKK